MSSSKHSRRRFLQSTSAAAALASVPYIFTASGAKADDVNSASKNERPVLGCIGTGSRWDAVGPNAMEFSDCVAVCDVDEKHRNKAKEVVKKRQNRDVEQFEDYRKILDRKDIDVVTIVTPDHWHTKIAIEAMQAGKDVYCEKPLTLTIDEGKQIIKVLKETGRTFQVGTQQRSEMGQMFLKAAAIVRSGRIGKVEKVECAIGGAPTSDVIPVAEVPSGLNWDMWLGQAPKVDFRTNGKNTRCHYEFRWWYEYSGGKMTDWGAHHVDIAQWAIGMDKTGPLSVAGEATHPVPFKDGYPTDPSKYNTATKFKIECQFANDIQLVIRDSHEDFDNGILFTGSKGKLFVNRGKLTGKVVDELKENPLPEELIRELYKGKLPEGGNAHMRNFFQCMKDGGEPVSDVFTHHRAMTTCHLANIAIRLGRPLKWNPETEQIEGDEAANAWQRREQRKGYEINS